MMLDPIIKLLKSLLMVTLTNSSNCAVDLIDSGTVGILFACTQTANELRLS